MQVTRWQDKEGKDLSEIIKKMLEEKADCGDTSGRVQYKNIKLIKKFDEDKTIELNSKTVTFNKIDFSYESVSTGLEPIEKKGFIIIYKNGSKINYIIDKNSEAQKTIRLFNNYTGRGEIEKVTTKLPNNFFNWLAKKIYSSENEFDANDSKIIKIEAIKGFKGNTEDALNRVSASGETVMNIISTFSFLLERGNITQISLDIAYGGHQNIDLSINNSGVISTEYSKYIGDLTQEDAESALCKVLLTIYLEIIPIIFNYHDQEVVDDEWNDEKNIEFLRDTAKKLSEAVQTKIDDMTE